MLFYSIESLNYKIEKAPTISDWGNMRGMGFEPMRLAPRELESRSLTTRTSALCSYTKEHSREKVWRKMLPRRIFVEGGNRTHSGYPIAPQAITFPFGHPHTEIIRNLCVVVLGIEPRLQESKSCVLAIIRYNQN